MPSWGRRNGTCSGLGKEINVMIFALQRQTPKHSFHFTVPRPESVVSARPSDSSLDIKMFINFFHPEITICLMAFVGLSLSLIHFFHLPKAAPSVSQCMFLRRHDWDLSRLLLLMLPYSHSDWTRAFVLINSKFADRHQWLAEPTVISPSLVTARTAELTNN